MKKEYELILQSVLKNKSKEEIDNISRLLENKLDWCEIAGQLLNHRLWGYFYYGLNEDQRKRIPKEMRKALKSFTGYQQRGTSEKYDEFKKISESLDRANIRYCALKGLVFNADFYNFAERRSNDIDIMVLEDDLNKLDEEMRKMGYIQSLLPDGMLVEASKREKIVQRMNYHDLVPYVKMIDGSIMEVDINFKFDCKENDIDHGVYNRGIQVYKKDGYEIKGLPFDTHLLFLCIHFFREGTNTLWTAEKRDVLLYKIVDIVNWIRVHDSEFCVEEWCELAKEYNLEKKCYFTFEILSQFYDIKKLKEAKEILKPEDTSFMDSILVEGEKRYIKRAKSFAEESFDWEC